MMTPEEKRKELAKRIKDLCIDKYEPKEIDLSYLDSYYKYADDFQGPIVNEPFLEKEEKYIFFPIEDEELLEHGEDQNRDFWITDEVKMSKDADSWDEMSVDLQFFIAIIFAFFAASDGLVNYNLFENFQKEVKSIEARYNYYAQMHIEAVHSKMYSLMITNVIKDNETINNLFLAASKMPIIKRKIDWGEKWINSDHPFIHRLFAFCIVEGIFFSGSFSVIVLFGKMNLLPGAVHANDFIRRDEGKHVRFGILLFKRLKNLLKSKVVYGMITEAVEIEKDYFETALPKDIPNFNSDIISQYIEYVADKLLSDLGYPIYYGQVECPIPEMVKTAVPSKKNFFEKRENAYGRENSSIQDEDSDDEVF